MANGAENSVDKKADRLTVENQPSNEGPFRLQGPIHHPDDEICSFEILDNFERFA